MPGAGTGANLATPPPLGAITTSGILSGLRIRVILIVLVAAVPAIALVWVQSSEHGDSVRRAQHDQALHLARLVASEQLRLIDGALPHMRELLDSAGQGGDISSALCAGLLDADVATGMGLSDFGLVAPDGRFLCAYPPASAAATVADSDWFRRVRAEKRLVVADHLVLRLSGRPVIAFALPKLDARGRVAAVAVAGIDHAWLARYLAPVGLPEGSRVLIVDRHETVLATYPASIPLMKPGDSAKLLKETPRPVDATSGLVDGRDPQGVERLGAYAVVPAGPTGERMAVYVGIPASMAVATASHIFAVALVGSIVAAVAAILLAWLGGGLLVVRPAQVIAGAARRIASGDLTARTGIRSGSEIGRIARDVDAMAAVLEQRAAEAEQKGTLYQSLVDNLPAAVYQVVGPPPGSIGIQLNDPGFGTPKGVPVTVEELCETAHPDDRARLAADVREAVESGSDLTTTYRELRPEGGVRWVQMVSRAVEGPAGDVRRQGVRFDITEQRERAETIARYAARLEELSAITGAALAERDFGQVAQFALAALRRVLPLAQAGIGVWAEGQMRCLALDPPDGPPLFPPDETRARLDKGGTVLVPTEPALLYVPLLTRDAALGALAVSAPSHVLDLEATEFLETVARELALAFQQSLLVDALRAQAHVLEERVALRTAELREANGELSQFSTTVAHDLRTPLRTMRGFSLALLDDHAQALGEEGRDFARRIVAAAESMDALVTDLLAYARMGPGGAVDVVPVRLDACAADALERVADDVRRLGATVTVAGPLGWALGSHQPVVVVLANLVQNAVTFVRDAAPVVCVRTERHDGEVRLCVDDNGIGVPEKDADRIWAVFERLHPHHVFPGTGVGLAIVAKAATRMGGRYGVEPRPGGGSTFWITLQDAPGAGGAEGAA